jgi:uncharacterized protein
VKLQPDRIDADLNVITAYSADRLAINGQDWQGSVLLPWSGVVQPWRAQRFEDLAAQDFEAVARLHPALVIFGSGAKLRFPAPACLRPLIDAAIGHEVMDTAAACRTYTVLVAEGRKVVAALLR